MALWITTESGQAITTEDGLIIVTETPPPGPPAPLSAIIPAYVYQQYADDINVVAFFTAYNQLAQTYLDWFNATPLAIYSNPQISGPLLDWIGQGIYGISRPVFASLTSHYIAGNNSAPVNAGALNGSTFMQSGTATVANDDYYKRVMTWILYAGTSRRFNVEWLRMRVARFLYGVNGTDASLSQAQNVHINAGGFLPPPTPMLSSAAGGSFPARTYGVRMTYVTSLGETLAGPAGSILVPADSLLTVTSPPSEAGVDGWNAYVAELTAVPSIYLAGLNSGPVNGTAVNGTNFLGVDPFTKQNISPIALGSSWMEPDTGLIFGDELPTVNTSNPNANFFITIPAGTASQFFQQAFEQGVLPFPFQLTATIIIEP